MDVRGHERDSDVIAFESEAPDEALVIPHTHLAGVAVRVELSRCQASSDGQGQRDDEVRVFRFGDHSTSSAHLREEVRGARVYHEVDRAVGRDHQSSATLEENERGRGGADAADGGLTTFEDFEGGGVGEYERGDAHGGTPLGW